VPVQVEAIARSRLSGSVVDWARAAAFTASAHPRPSPCAASSDKARNALSTRAFCTPVVDGSEVRGTPAGSISRGRRDPINRPRCSRRSGSLRSRAIHDSTGHPVANSPRRRHEPRTASTTTSVPAAWARVRFIRSIEARDIPRGWWVPDASASARAAAVTSAESRRADACFSATSLASLARSSATPSPASAETAMISNRGSPSSPSSRRRSLTICLRSAVLSRSIWLSTMIMESTWVDSGLR